MFAVDCPRHRARVLLGPRAIEGLRNTTHGIVVHWRCRCGARGTLATGRPTPVLADPAPAAAPAA